jgi:Transposase
MGRRSTFNAHLAERVIHAMLEGTTVVDACRQIGIKRSTFNGWVRADRGGLEARYMRAQEIQMDVWGDDMLEIVDTSAASSECIERQMYMLRARCEKILAKHARVAAKKRDARIAAIVAKIEAAASDAEVAAMLASALSQRT